MSNRTILIVEDEVKLAGLLSDYLSNAHFNTHIIHNGLDVLPWLETHHCDLIVLDLMLPGMDGLRVCREVRAKYITPIIMATAKVEEIDRLIGLELGADDYVCKPFSYREMVARIQATFRRLDRFSETLKHTQVKPDDNEQPRTESPFTLDRDAYEAKLNGENLGLTAVEFNLLFTLVEHEGKIFNREQLMSSIYPEYRVVSDRTIDSHVKKLRQKIRKLTSEEYIHSIYSVGYKFLTP